MSDKKRMIITGASGLLGSNLAYALREKYNIIGLYNSHKVHLEGIQTKKTDLLSKDMIEETLAESNPDVIIHCAALANIDTCEKEQKLAYELNVVVTQNLIQQTRNTKVKFIHVSTDSVYDGINGHYKETDEVCPISVYGFTKYQGEQEALKNSNAIIARTNFFGFNIQNRLCLAEWIVHELSQRRKVKGFTDVYFSAIYTFKLAHLFDLAIKEDINGIYHFASSTFFSKYNFAVELARLFNLDSSLIDPIFVDNFEFAAKRGKNLMVNTEKLKKDLGVEMPPMADSIKAFYTDFQKRLPQEIKKDFALSTSEVV